jgi:hypothetical protein
MLVSRQVFRGKPPFKDYCLILQVHPEADAAMIDAAYWHLAKRYSEGAPNDPHAWKKIDDLNEAYNVLGSPDRRDEYMKIRTEVLGLNALPELPPPPPGKQPLTVMDRQRPRPREEPAEAEEVRRLWARSAISSALALPVVLGLSVAAFLAGASSVVVAGLLLGGLLFTAIPLAPAVVRLGPSISRLPALPSVHVPIGRPSLRGASQRHTRATITPIDSARLQSSTRSRAEQLRRHDAHQPSSPPVEDPRD